jgi:hypothetical protein
MKKKTLLRTFTLIVIVIFASNIIRAQCHYVPSTSTSTDTLSYVFSGGTFASYGCAPIDPTYWISGSGNTVTINFVHPQSNPSIRVWGMNTDDVASISINDVSYPLTSSSASYDTKVVCGVSPGPDGVIFSGGNLTGANDNVQANYSYQNVRFKTQNVTSITVTGLSGAGWGFAGASVYCYPLAVQSETFTAINLFPNPTTGPILIQGQMVENAEVSIINDMGICMKKMKAVNNNIDISDFPQGMYSLLIEINNQIIAKRIIKL